MINLLFIALTVLIWVSIAQDIDEDARISGASPEPED